MYVFPGIGLGTILAKATRVTQSMIYAAATSLSIALSATEVERGLLYPEVERIRDVSVQVAMGVIRAAQGERVDRETVLKELNDEQLKHWVYSKMYDPHNETQRLEREVSVLLKESKEDEKEKAHEGSGSHL